MKSLQHTIKESLQIGICDEVKVPVYESLRIGIDDKPYQYVPKNLNELRELIDQRISEEGEGTESHPIDLNDIDVSNIIDFNRLFIGTYAQQRIKYIDISDWNVSNCTSFSNMFINCYKLISIGDIGNWDVRSVDSTHAMFRHCEKLEYIGDLSNWNFERIRSLSMMFDECENLKDIGDISNWDISTVQTLGFMFNRCKKLSNIGDLNKWKFSNLTNAFHNSYIFAKCNNITIPKWYDIKNDAISAEIFNK